MVARVLHIRRHNGLISGIIFCSFCWLEDRILRSFLASWVENMLGRASFVAVAHLQSMFHWGEKGRKIEGLVKSWITWNPSLGRCEVFSEDGNLKMDPISRKDKFTNDLKFKVWYVTQSASQQSAVFPAQRSYQAWKPELFFHGRARCDVDSFSSQGWYSNDLGDLNVG